MQRLRVSTNVTPALPSSLNTGFPPRVIPAFFRSNRKCALSAFAIATLLCGIPASTQQFSQGFQGAAPQSGSSNAAESAAYAAAVSQPNAAVKASALQQFLVQYPNSPLRQRAIEQMMMAKHQSQGGAIPPPAMSPPQSAVTTPRPASANAMAPAAAPVQQTYSPRESLLQQSPKPAQVTAAAHSLTIKADNSTLSQILHEISGSTGMKVDGLAQDQRIFGSYGPGEPRVVLLSLLEGSGYNVVMIGDTAGGTPRLLSLTQRTASSASSGSAAPSRSAPQEEEDDQDVQQATPEPPPVAQPSQPGSPDPNQPRTPQDIQQEMLRLRQQQQQGAPPAGPPQ